MTIVEFLNARLDEYEKRLEWTSSRGTWKAHRDYLTGRRGLVMHSSGSELGEFVHPADAEHAAYWDPSRVIAEIKAKRAIIKRHSGYHECWPGGGSIKGAEDDDCFSEDFEREPCLDMRDLASVYSGHPDYDQAWVSPQVSTPRG